MIRAHNRLQTTSSLIWITIAAFVGMGAAFLPIEYLVPLLALGAFALLIGITPFAALPLLLILAPLRTLIATESALQLPLDIGQITLVIFLATWALHHVVVAQRIPVIPWSPIFIPLFTFLAVISLGVFNATSISAWLNEWLKWVEIIIIVALMLHLSTGTRWTWVVFALIVAGLANAVIGFYEFLGGSGADHLLILDRFFRAFGTFGQPNPFAGFMGLLSPLALMAAWGYAGMWHKHRRSLWLGIATFYFGAFLILSGAILISWSRGAWLGFAASLGIIALALPRKLWHGVMLAGGILLLFAGLWLTGILPDSIVARLASATEEFFAFEDMRGIEITSENYAVAERLSLWQAALNMAREHPWLGVGMGNYDIVYDRYRLINWEEPLGHAHNYYLNMLAEAGLLGLLVYGKVWIIIILLSWRIRRHPDVLARAVGVGLLGTWTYLSVHSFFDNLYVNNLFLHIGFLIGLAAVLFRQIANTIRIQA